MIVACHGLLHGEAGALKPSGQFAHGPAVGVGDGVWEEFQARPFEEADQQLAARAQCSGELSECFLKTFRCRVDQRVPRQNPTDLAV